jgi:hypothetical protein
MRLAGYPEHQRNTRSVNISIEDTDIRALAGERERKIDGSRGFADAAFAGCDCDDVFDVFERFQVALHAMCGDFGAQIHGNIFNSGTAPGGFNDGLHEIGM